MTNIDTVLFLKALSDETRLQIVQMLSHENLCACHILEKFEFTQPTLSYHMKILVESGLVESHKDGTWTRYTLNTSITKELGTLFTNLSSDNVTDRKIVNC